MTCEKLKFVGMRRWKSHAMENLQDFTFINIGDGNTIDSVEVWKIKMNKDIGDN